jgi:ABC-type multidrug transport system fused ATPase/permease subunit
MILRQTAALFVDAYRELNARKLFWITMVLSGLVVLIFALVGIDQRGISFAGLRFDFAGVTSNEIPKDVFYLGLFSSIGISIWLTWVATILALISTSSIFPDLITGGAIETVLSKPIGRIRLFLTKFATGLLFVALQVGVFSLLSFVVIGVRGGVWEPGIFLAVPIVVVFFSYLFAVNALLGLLTRSTIAALLVTGVFWFVLFILNAGDAMLVQFREQTRYVYEAQAKRVERAEEFAVNSVRQARQREGLPHENYEPTDEEMQRANPALSIVRMRASESEDELRQLQRWSGLVFGVKSVLPKTGETADLLERHLIDLDAISFDGDGEGTQAGDDGDVDIDMDVVSRRVQEVFRSRDVAWVLGTSLAFEAVILGVCCLIFARRDF